MSFAFRIDGRTLTVPVDTWAGDEFEVRSVPRPYTVRWVDDRPLALVRRLVAAYPRAFLLVDSNVRQLHLAELELPLERHVIAEVSEAYKTISGGVLPLVDRIAAAGLTRADRLIVVGGGICQDVGGFAAAMYKRGLPWSLVPSTLLSMCDSCIGAKTGINHGGAKNQLALFSAPAEVTLCPELLETLPRRELQAGLGEILKLHVTGGPAMLDRYQARMDSSGQVVGGHAGLRDLIAGALAVKRAVIEVDEFELDLRRSLNYGHTIGHAIEVLSDYQIPHGHAVTAGMLLANGLAARRGLLSEAVAGELDRLGRTILDADSLAQLGAMPRAGLTSLLAQDKKAAGNVLTFILMAGAGDTRFVKVPNDAQLASELGGLLDRLFGA